MTMIKKLFNEPVLIVAYCIFNITNLALSSVKRLGSEDSKYLRFVETVTGRLTILALLMVNFYLIYHVPNRLQKRFKVPLIVKFSIQIALTFLIAIILLFNYDYVIILDVIFFVEWLATFIYLMVIFKGQYKERIFVILFNSIQLVLFLAFIVLDAIAIGIALTVYIFVIIFIEAIFIVTAIYRLFTHDNTSDDTTPYSSVSVA